MRFSEFLNSEHADRPHLLLFGSTVSHSLSPIMHNLAAEHYGFDLRYFAVDLPEEEFVSLPAHFNREHFRGANITVPYKERFVPYVDELDRSASQIGAVNTIYKKDGRLKGANSDLYGFLKPLESHQKELDGARAIVFGTGGAARAVVSGLIQVGVEEIVLVSRTPGRITSFDRFHQVTMAGYAEWPAYAEASRLVVNTTPLGMEPDTESSPVREQEKELLQGKICYDIVYKPLQTEFLRLAEEAGAVSVGGLDMLIYQGSMSFELWTGKSFPIEKIRQKLYATFQQ